MSVQLNFYFSYLLPCVNRSLHFGLFVLWFDMTSHRWHRVEATQAMMTHCCLALSTSSTSSLTNSPPSIARYVVLMDEIAIRDDDRQLSFSRVPHCYYFRSASTLLEFCSSAIIFVVLFVSALRSWVTFLNRTAFLLPLVQGVFRWEIPSIARQIPSQRLGRWFHSVIG